MAPALLGMGNPLLDIMATVGQETLEKYDIQMNNAVLAEEKHMPLYGELAEKEDVKYIAGGATQNSIRVAQWMLQEPGQTAYMGCVGEDEYAKKMRDVCKVDGVDARYMVDKKTPTGTCAVAIKDSERSLIANLSAANNYKVDHLKEKENMAVLEGAKVVYSAGFFITVSPESIALASSKDSIYCLNLSAPFIMQVPPFKACLVNTLPHVDYLFGNESEAMTFAETEGWDTTDIAFIATRLSLIPSARQEFGRRHRTVVITQGCEETIVARNGHVRRFPIIKLEREMLVDTNGAGDAYVGGFLAALVKGGDIGECCKAGAYAASVIVQHSGCTYPKAPEYKW